MWGNLQTGSSSVASRIVTPSALTDVLTLTPPSPFRKAQDASLGSHADGPHGCGKAEVPAESLFPQGSFLPSTSQAGRKRAVATREEACKSDGKETWFFFRDALGALDALTSILICLVGPSRSIVSFPNAETSSKEEAGAHEPGVPPSPLTHMFWEACVHISLLCGLGDSCLSPTFRIRSSSWCLTATLSPHPLLLKCMRSFRLSPACLIPTPRVSPDLGDQRFLSSERRPKKRWHHRDRTRAGRRRG